MFDPSINSQDARNLLALLERTTLRPNEVDVFCLLRDKLRMIADGVALAGVTLSPAGPATPPCEPPAFDGPLDRDGTPDTNEA